jgi:hypothetical protein
MGLFKKKKSDFIDWSANQRREPKGVDFSAKSPQSNSFSSSSNSFNKPVSQESSVGAFSIFGGADVASTVTKNNSPEYVNFSSSSINSDSSGDAEEKRKKLSKRIMDMTDRLEELSNQMYKLQQRVELLERKTNIGRGY